MFIYVCIYIYIYIFICTYLYIYIYIELTQKIKSSNHMGGARSARGSLLAVWAIAFSQSAGEDSCFAVS